MRHWIPVYLQKKASICYKTQLQPQWNSRTAGNKRWFCHNVMKTLELLQHRSKQSEGDSTQGSYWGLLSHLHTSAALSLCVFSFFYVFSHFLLAKSLQKPTMSSRKNKTKENQNWEPPTDGLIWEGLAELSLAYTWLKKVTFTPGKRSLPQILEL